METMWQVVFSTLLWALGSTLLTVGISIPVALLLTRRDFPGKSVISTLLSLPLVLPPTAVGYILLQLIADDGWIGLDLHMLFTWKAVLLACAVMSFPLVVRTVRVSFEAIDPQLEHVARTLGKSRWVVFWGITMPLASRGLIAAAILGFTRAMGEFGATVTIAGNIPGRTQTLSSAIYSAQQAGDGSRATFLLIVSLTIGFLAVFLTEWLTRPGAVRK